MTVSKKKLDSLAYYDQIKNSNELKEGIDESYDVKRGFWYDGTGAYSHCFADGEEIGLVPQGGTSSLAMFCQGINPATGETLVSQKCGKGRRPGYDMTQSAPKWVSVLWSQADPETRKQIEAMVIAAAKQGVDALNAYAGSTTSGAQGKERIDCKYAAALYLDLTGRPVDAKGDLLPEKKIHLAMNEALGAKELEAYIDCQLHVHTLLPNVVLCADGRYRKVEGSILFQWQGVMAETFHASLAEQLQAAGFVINNELEKVAFGIDGIPEAAIFGFSKRTGQIEQNKAKENFDAVADLDIARKLLQKIKTDGRMAHTDASKEAIEAQWEARGKLYGFGKDQCAILIAEANARKAAGIVIEQPTLADAKAVLDKLLETESVISDAKFRAACLGMFTGSGTVADINALVDESIRTHAVVLGREGSTQVISSEEMVTIEKGMIRIAKDYKAKGDWSKADVKEAIRANYDKMLKASGKRMSRQQIRAAHFLLDFDGGVLCLEGRAGAGKSFLINVLQELANSPAGKKAGIELIGTSISWAASRNLADEGGISAAAAVADFIARLESGKLVLKRGGIVVVDEAGIVGSRDMYKILAAAEKAGARVILAGDTRQISSVSAGGAFSAIVRTNGSFTLNEVRRQEAQWDKEAGLAISEGKADEALKAYAEHDRIHISGSRNEALKAMFDAYIQQSEAEPEQSQLMIAKTNKDVAELNAMAHAARQRGGQVGEDVPVTVMIEKKESEIKIGVGDVIQFRVKSNPVDIVTKGQAPESGQVYNRTRARIEKIEGAGKDATLTVRLFEGDKLRDKVLTISGKDFRNGLLNLDLAYCMTVDSAQGQTYDNSFVMGAGYDRARAYVACTRHRKNLKVFGDLDTLHAAMSTTYSNTEFVTRNNFTKAMAIESMTGMWSTEKRKKTTLDWHLKAKSQDRMVEVAGRTDAARTAGTVRQRLASLTEKAGHITAEIKERIRSAWSPSIQTRHGHITLPRTANALEIQKAMLAAISRGSKEFVIHGNARFRQAAADAVRLGELDVILDVKTTKLIKEDGNEQRNGRHDRKDQRNAKPGKRAGTQRASTRTRGPEAAGLRAASVSSLDSKAPRLGPARKPHAGAKPVHQVQEVALASSQSVSRQGGRHRG
jgi:hypothetical protein